MKFFKEFIFGIVACIKMKISTFCHFCHQKRELDVILMYSITHDCMWLYFVLLGIWKAPVVNYIIHMLCIKITSNSFLMTKVTSTCNLYTLYTIVKLCDFHCICKLNSLTFVSQAVSHCVTKLWVLWKSLRWFQRVWAVLAFDNAVITFATIWSHSDHIFESATRTLQQQNQLAEVHTNVSKVVWNKFKQYDTEYSSLWWCFALLFKHM